MATTLHEHLLASRRLHRSGGGTVLDILLRAQAMPAAELRAALQAEAGVASILDASEATPDFSRLHLEQAKALGAVVCHGRSGGLMLALADPWDDDPLRQVAQLLGSQPEPAAASAAVFEQWLPKSSSAIGLGAMARESGSAVATGPVVDFVDSAVRAAQADGASDVHFECDRSGVTVRLRQDGVMLRFARMEGRERAEEVISRIKVLAQLDITERRTPQDGRFRFGMDAGNAVDLRVSIMPSVHGEDAVLRLLDKARLRAPGQAVTLEALGFSADGAPALRRLAGMPHGMVLVTGPTGSGKTTTVYALLSEIHTGLEKIVTIEDPVEYELPGVLQIPVNERKGLTFAKGLRSILRHDPDRILVGEIRDAETAEIAVQSALTGHQVFTTVHANNLFDVTGRFRHFGLDMFGFMSALSGVVVQRLVRTLCPNCAGSRDARGAERDWLLRSGCPADRVPTAKGCDACHGSGFRGRTVLAEVHTIDDAFRDLVISGRSVSDLRRHVDASGVEPLDRQSARLVVDGRTTAEEIARVVGW